MGPGASGDVVKAYQQRLVDIHFDPGAVDGKYGGDMAYAVEALQKIMGAPRTGRIGAAEAVGARRRSSTRRRCSPTASRTAPRSTSPSR